jgi:hypothetical protein
MANYTIIGGDGKQYGPVSGGDLHQWIADGRVHAQTQAQSEGAPEWKALSEFSEFAGAFRNSAPPPLPASAPAPPAKTSAMAVTSLVLGILGMFTCGITALIGLVFGIIALVKVKNSGGRLGGFGLALAGTIVSGIFLLMIPMFAAMMLPALAAAKQKAMEINCVNNETQLAEAIKVYSGDNGNHFPPAATWCDVIKNEAGGNEKVFKCPAANSGSRCDYAFNAKLDGMDESKINSQTVMIFESDGGWDANGGKELMLTHARHENGRVFVVAFADGSVQQLRASQLATLRWDP